MVTLRQIHIFTEVVRHGSFRACAGQTGLSQAVVSNHIRELEAGLGVTLFERRAGQATVLTTQGRHAFDRLSAILSDLADLRQELAGETARRTIRFSTFSYIVLRFQDAIERFQQNHAHVDLRFLLDPLDNQTLAMQVRRGDIDMAAFFTLDPQEVPDSKPAGEARLAVYIGCDHPLAARGQVSGAELSEHPAIVLARANAQRGLCDQALEVIGARAEKILMETDALPLLFNNVRRGLAWVCLFEDTVDEAAQGLVKLDLLCPIPPIGIRVLTRPSARHDRNILALCESIL